MRSLSLFSAGLLNDDAELIIAAHNQKAFEPIRRYAVADGATWAQPAISGNRVFIKDVSTLTLWTFDWRRFSRIVRRHIGRNCCLRSVSIASMRSTVRRQDKESTTPTAMMKLPAGAIPW
jgi:hypothetical protein